MVGRAPAAAAAANGLAGANGPLLAQRLALLCC